MYALIQFHALGNVNPIVSVWISNTRFDSLADFPFHPLGFLALVILFQMAATSHNFWLANLTPPMWKTLRMLVYVVYALVIMHVTLGVLQSEKAPVLPIVLGVGLVWILALHLLAAQRGAALDAERSTGGGPIDVCGVGDVPVIEGELRRALADRCD